MKSLFLGSWTLFNCIIKTTSVYPCHRQDFQENPFSIIFSFAFLYIFCASKLDNQEVLIDSEIALCVLFVLLFLILLMSLSNNLRQTPISLLIKRLLAGLFRWWLYSHEPKISSSTAIWMKISGWTRFPQCSLPLLGHWKLVDACFTLSFTS